jgi:hypothetical protein
MAGLFISYRRDDSQGFAGRMAGDLSRILGEDRVFSDIEIPAGSDFGEVLHRAIAASDALLVVIGRRWAANRGDDQRSRLFDAGDWVRTEIEAAFAQGKPVFPVLVGGATMPPADQLPDSIRRLTRLQAARLDDRHWQADIEGLVAQLRATLPAAFGAAAQRSATPAATAPGQDATPAQVLREIAQRVLDESRQPHPAPTPTQVRRPRRWHAALAASLWRRLRGFMTLAVALVLIYIGLRLFGDDEVLRGLDAFEARLQLGWQRLQSHMPKL